jgi:branched-chain amino acid transport system permease protein
LANLCQREVDNDMKSILGTHGRQFVLCLIIFGAVSALPLSASQYWIRLANMGLIATIAVLGLNFILGYTGQISLMHSAITGIGAYILAILTTKAGINPWIGALAGICGAGLTSYLIGLMLLRLKGHHFALATLGVNVSLGIVASNWSDVTGGTNGITGIPSINFFGWIADSETSFFYVALLVAVVAIALAAYIRHSEVGRSMIAVRDDELAASVSGLDLTKIKVTASTLGGLYAGLAGVMFAFHARFVAPEDFNTSQSIFYLAMLVVGGEATILGSIVGAALITFLPEFLRPLGSAYLVVFGVIVVLMLFAAPKGLVGVLSLFKRRNSADGSTRREGRWRFSKSGQ